MSDFRNRFMRFMYGRYGQDELYLALFVTDIVCLFLGALCSLLGRAVSALSVVGWVLYALSLAVLVWAVFRVMSKNISARQRENFAYLRLRDTIRSSFKRPKTSLPPDTPTHVFRACPACSAVLRLPRQPGKHTARCPRCQKSFTVRIKK